MKYIANPVKLSGKYLKYNVNYLDFLEVMFENLKYYPYFKFKLRYSENIIFFD
jgi:hypothetical protein